MTGADGVLVVYGGRVVAEWRSPRYREPYNAMSVTKSIASLLIGHLADDGLLGYDQAISDILPSWRGAYSDSVTVRQLLTHSSGFSRREDQQNSVLYATDKSAFVLSQSPDRAPGESFDYSNEAVQLLEPIIHALTGLGASAYARAALFEPLGLYDSSINAAGGSAWLYSGFTTTLRDLARIGQMMRAGGLWRGKRIVSAIYLAEALKPSALNPASGMLWWLLDERRTLAGFYAHGYLNNDLYVFRDWDLVIVRAQMSQGDQFQVRLAETYFKRAMSLFKRLVAAR